MRRALQWSRADVDFTEISLRVIGAFYAFAGYVATRAGLTSHFIDRAIAAIAMKKPPRVETAQTVWLMCAAMIVLAGGVALMLLLDFAPWLFLASALGQAAYIYYVAPRYFDAENPPDAAGRKGSFNAFVLYSAATAFVLWAGYMGKLQSWHEVPAPVLAVAVAAVAGHAGYVVWMLARPMGSSPMPSFGAGPDEGIDPELDRAQSKRIKVMADYDAHPLWALDENIYGDFPPEHLGPLAGADARSQCLGRRVPVIVQSRRSRKQPLERGATRRACGRGAAARRAAGARAARSAGLCAGRARRRRGGARR